MTARMKRCTKCKEAKPLDHFYENKLGRDGRQPQCIKCLRKSSKRANEYGKTRNKDAKVARGACHDCDLPITRDTTHRFDWDHRDPSQKKYSIGRTLQISDKAFYDEIAKCDLVCKICHSDRTELGYASGTIKRGRPQLIHLPGDPLPQPAVEQQEALF